MRNRHYNLDLQSASVRLKSPPPSQVVSCTPLGYRLLNLPSDTYLLAGIYSSGYLVKLWLHSGDTTLGKHTFFGCRYRTHPPHNLRHYWLKVCQINIYQKALPM